MGPGDDLEDTAGLESARVSLVLYVDEQMLEYLDTAEVHGITLSYTFFKQDNLFRKRCRPHVA